MSRNSQMRSISSAGQPWKRGERERVRQVRGILQIAGPRIVRGNFGTQLFDHGAGVAHAVQELLHLFAFDAGQIVADAEVENCFARGAQQCIAAKRRIAAEHFDQHRAGDVFAQRIGHQQFLRPLDVVADVGHVDAGAADRQGGRSLAPFSAPEFGRRPRSSAEYSEPFACGGPAAGPEAFPATLP